MYLSKDNKVWLEEQINLIMMDPEIKERRNRAIRWVSLRLARELQKRLLDELQITPKQWEQFQVGRSEEVEEKILGYLSLSKQRKTEFLLLKKANQSIANEWLMRQLVERERNNFYKRAGIDYQAWNRFKNCSAYTSEDTIGKIVKALELTPAEEKEFRALVFYDTFSVTDELKEHVRGKIEDRKYSFAGFLDHAELSENAWEPFGPNRHGKPTSQGTLLKILLGAAMTETEGRELLQYVNSDFVMRRDLVVLLCVRNGIYDKCKVYYILEYFARDYGQRPFYRNLYADPGLE